MEKYDIEKKYEDGIYVGRWRIKYSPIEDYDLIAFTEIKEPSRPRIIMVMSSDRPGHLPRLEEHMKLLDLHYFCPWPKD